MLVEQWLSNSYSVEQVDELEFGLGNRQQGT